jgi:hypothetical protein
MVFFRVELVYSDTQQPSAKRDTGKVGTTYREGSTLFPAALFFNFFSVAGPMFARWSEVGAVMMVSQMTALLV